MKLAQLLLKALTGIGDDLVEEAARPALPRPRWLRLLPWAALFALLVGGALALQRLTPPAAPDAAPSGQEASLQTLPPDEAEETAPAEPDAPEPDAAALPAALARFHAPRGAYTLERSGFLVGSQVAVDYDGRVIAETDSGVVSLVWDYATGEVAAVAVEEWAPGQTVPTADNRISLYSLEGENVLDLQAFSLSLMGDVALVLGPGGTSLYRRSDRTLLAQDQYTALCIGTDLIAVQPTADAATWLLYGTDGALIGEARPQDSLTCYSWAGRGYLCAVDAHGAVGLLDSQGQWAVEPQYDEVYDVQRGYALCRRGAVYTAVSLADGTALSTEQYIQAAFAQGILYSAGSGAVLQAWDGETLLENIQTVQDTDADGSADLAVRMDGNTYTTLALDGTVLASMEVPSDQVYWLSAQVLLCIEPQWESHETWSSPSSDLFLCNIRSGEVLRDLGRHYTSGFVLHFQDSENAAPLNTGLFTASYQAADGSYHTDLLDETGRLLLTDFISYNGGGVATVEIDGAPALQRLDGTVIYPQSAGR